MPTKGYIECGLCGKLYHVHDLAKTPEEVAKEYGLCFVELSIEYPEGRTVETKFYACRECAEKLYENLMS